MSRLTTAIIRLCKLTDVIGTGMFSVVVKHTETTVLKYTVCPAFNDWAYVHKEEQQSNLRFVNVEYHSSEYIDFKNDTILVVAFEMPLLNKFFIKDLDKQSKMYVHKWKKYVQAVFKYSSGINAHLRDNPYKAAKLAMEEVYTDADENFLINLQNMYNSMPNTGIIDLKTAGNLMMGNDGLIYIIDPIFCSKTAHLVK